MERTRENRPLKERKQPEIYFLGYAIAASVELITNVIQLIHDQNVFSAFPLPPIPVWLDFYRMETSQFIKRILDIFIPLLCQISPAVECMVGPLQRQKIQTKDEYVRWIENDFKNKIAEIANSDGDIEAFLLRKGIDEKQINYDQIESNLAEIQFVIKVFIPCLYYYRTSPHALFEKAQGGDINAICKLIKLDQPRTSPILAETPIMEHVLQLEREHHKQYEAKIGEAVRSSGLPVVKPGRAKLIIAAGIQTELARSSKAQCDQIFPADWRELFNIMTKRKSGDPYDYDIDMKDSPESLRKEMDRQRQGWEDPDSIDPFKPAS